MSEPIALDTLAERLSDPELLEPLAELFARRVVELLREERAPVTGQRVTAAELARVRAIEALLEHVEASGDALAAALGLPTTTARRTFEKLEAHGIAAHTVDAGKSHRWTLTEKGRGLWEAATAGPAVTPPEMAGHL